MAIRYKTVQETQRAFAEAALRFGLDNTAYALRCSRATVNALIAGDRSPGMALAAKIEALFGIDMHSWVDQAVVKSIRKVAA